MVDTVKRDSQVKGRIGKYYVTKKIGQGFSAKIKLAHDDESNKFALKIFDKRKEDNDVKAMKLLRDEVQHALGLDSKHVAKYYEF